MTNQVIPDAAVEAGQAEVERMFGGDLVGGASDTLVRVILEAAVPHMLAEAWDIGYGYGRNGDFTNPYRTAK